MTEEKLVSVDFKLEWKSQCAKHTDVFHVSNIDLINDNFPAGFAEKIAALKVGESFNQTFQAKELLGEDFSSKNVISFDTEHFNQNFKNQNSPPMLYRFYPSAIAWQGLDSYETDTKPFRLISINESNMVGDRNHPLAKYYLTLTATKTEESDNPIKERAALNITKIITMKGPGMQVPFEYGDSIFLDNYPFSTDDERSNTARKFDKKIDDSTTTEIAKLHTQLLLKHSKVLDLVSDSETYLEANYETGLLTGLGYNENKLAANPLLDTYHVQNLNEDTGLPFETDSFDDAICSLSIETLIDPLAIMRELSRVIKPGGKFIVTFTNRYDTEKTIRLWPQLHLFERMQLVLEYFRQASGFDNLETYSKRGLPLSKNDKLSEQKTISDPIFAVWGTNK